MAKGWMMLTKKNVDDNASSPDARQQGRMSHVPEVHPGVRVPAVGGAHKLLQSHSR